MTVSEKWRVFRESLTETMSMSRREFLLTAAAGFLGGMVLGMMISPRKYTMIGSKNGNNSGDNNGNNNGQQIDKKKKSEDLSRENG